MWDVFYKVYVCVMYFIRCVCDVFYKVCVCVMSFIRCMCV